MGRSPLHYAALENDLDGVLALLATGADPNVQDAEGFTALHLASQEEAVAAARALLEGGAEVDRVNAHGNTPLWTAVFNCRGRGALIHLLLEFGADRHHANAAGETPVGLANVIANVDVAQFLEDRDA